MKRTTAPVEIRVNEDALQQVMRAAQRVDEVLGSGPVSTDAALSIRGVLEVVEADEADAARDRRHERLLADLAACLDGLAQARACEGESLAGTISGQIEEIARLASVIELAPARLPEAIAERLRHQVRRLIDGADELDEARLHQEVALLATRADIAEELDRLRAHVGAARALLADEGAVGRRFDFLAQEFNREANTICSKSNDTAVSQAGMALKVVIDQLREQVQNVE